MAVAVDDAIAKSVPFTKVSFAKAWTESFANGVEVPTPMRPFVASNEVRSSNEMFDPEVQYVRRLAAPEPVIEPPAPPTQPPLMAKHPEVMLIPTFEVEVAEPEMFKPESVVVPKPSAATERNLVAFEVEATSKSGFVCTPEAWTANFAYGVVVPTPTFPFPPMTILCDPLVQKVVDALVMLFTRFNEFAPPNAENALLPSIRLAPFEFALFPRTNNAAPVAEESVLSTWLKRFPATLVERTVLFVLVILPVTASADPGALVPIPTLPFVSIVSAVFVDVANVVGDEVARYRMPLIERKFHGLEVSDASVSVNCGAVDEETVSGRRGVVVPIPSAVAALFQKKFVLFSVSDVPFEKMTEPLVKEVAPVPPPATVSVPEFDGVMVKVVPELVIELPYVMPFKVWVEVASVIAPICAVPNDCWSERRPVLLMVSAVPPTSAPGVPVNEIPVPFVTDDVATDESALVPFP